MAASTVRRVLERLRVPPGAGHVTAASWRRFPARRDELMRRMAGATAPPRPATSGRISRYAGTPSNEKRWLA